MATSSSNGRKSRVSALAKKLGIRKPKLKAKANGNGTTRPAPRSRAATARADVPPPTHQVQKRAN